MTCMEYDPLPDPPRQEAAPSERREPGPATPRDPAPEPPAATTAPRQPPPAPGEARSSRRHRWMVGGVYPLLAAVAATAVGIGVAASIDRPQVETLDDFVPRLVTRIYDHGALELLEGTAGTSPTTETLFPHLFRAYSRENRMLLEEGELPQLLQNAILATEDVNFFTHGGIPPLKSILRAMVANIRGGRLEEGASTITMQLARDVFKLSRAKRFKRKFEETLLAVELEKKFSKPQILTLYANMINYGHGNYGVKAAALNYFNKSVADLTLAEAATLAGIPQRPSDHSVYRRPEAVVKRRNVVLGRMAAVDFITAEELEQARQEPLVVVERRRDTQVGPYFSEEVRRHLISTYGETELYDRGLQVFTTMDRDIQLAAEAAVREKLAALDHEKGWRGATDHLEGDGLETRALPSWLAAEPVLGEWYEGIVLASDRRKADVKIGEHTYELTRQGIEWTRRSRPGDLLKPGDVAWFRLQAPEAKNKPAKEEADEEEPEPILMLEQEPEMEAAVVVLESSTGAVRAMVGGWDFGRNEFNRATQARRQVGSAFKPFVFGAALENGFTAADTLFDGPVVFPGGPHQPDYSPRNFYRRYEGVLTLRRALEASINVTSVKLLDLVGVDRVIDFARRCGVESELPPYPSLALGTAELTPLELAAAYASFVNQGVYVAPYTIERVASRNGRTMQEHQPRAHKAMEPEVAYLLTHILRGVALRGTGAARLAKIELTTAGKTGTTDSFTDAWFVGFTPRYTILSWVGFDRKRFLGRGMTGAHAALPIWEALVRRGLEEGWLAGDEVFPVPPGIIEVEIEPRSGLLADAGAPQTLAEVFVEGTEPEKTFDEETARILELPWYLQEPFYLPKEGEKMPRQIDDWRAVKEVWKNKDKGIGPSS